MVLLFRERVGWEAMIADDFVDNFLFILNLAVGNLVGVFGPILSGFGHAYGYTTGYM